MSDESKTRGRQVGLSLVESIRAGVAARDKAPAEPLPAPRIEGLDELVGAIAALVENRPDFAPITEAIQALQLNASGADLAPIVGAIRALDEGARVDVSAIVDAIEAAQPVDLGTLETELAAIRAALEKSNVIMQGLVDVAKAEKFITYDAAGRVESIGVKK